MASLHLYLAAFRSLQNYAGKLWSGIRHYILQEYPDYTHLLTREDLAFRVAFRPRKNTATLPGFSDTNDQTETVSFWFGMDYEPKVGDYVGLTTEQPWENYMLPDKPSSEYFTLVYVYDNEGNQLVQPEQTTTCALPKPEYLRQFLRMIITVRWEDSKFDPSEVIVHDRTRESLADLCKKFGIDI